MFEFCLSCMQFFVCLPLSALPDAPRDVQVINVGPRSTGVKWNAPLERTGLVTSSAPEYLIQFRITDTEDWSEIGEDEIEDGLSYHLVGLRPYTYYELRVIPYVKYGRGTPSQLVRFRTAETG